jgi:HEAT repeat protein
MVDPVTLTTIGVLVGPIVGDLVQDALKDYVKDFFKDRVKDVETLAQKPFARNAVKESLTAFARLFLQQLAELGLKEKELKPFVKPLQQFVKEKPVRQSLGTAFDANCQQVDVAALSQCWQTVRCGKKPQWKQAGTPQWWKDRFPDAFYGKVLPSVPAGFDWQQLGEAYRQAVTEIVRNDAELREIFDSQNQERAADALETLAGIPKDFDLEGYRDGLLEQYNHLDFGSLDGNAGEYERTLTVQEIFIPQKARECQEYMPQLHELPVEMRQLMRERGDISAEALEAEQLERARRAYSQQSPRSILEIVEDSRYRYLVVLGDPGAGKSTLLKYLALQWAKLETQALTSQSVPLLIELRKYVQSKVQQECRDFLEFINGASTWIGHLPQNRLHEWLKAGRCIALFDGLDEVFDPQLRTQVIAQIHNFTQTYPDVKVVVTSRVIGYQPQKLKNAQFYHFMLEELEREQIDEFVRRWHELTFTDRHRKAAKLERLQKALEQRRTIRELAGNPLLLTMMAILNRNQELPRNRVKLYEKASEVLLHKWDVNEKQLKPGEAFDTYFIDEDVKQEICRKIAYRMQSGEKGLRGNVIEKEALRESVAEVLAGLVGEQAPTYAKWMVEQLRERNFILCYLGGNHEDYYAFVHRTFLEYFCAWAFVWKFEKERSIDLEYLKAEVFGKHWRDESWHEVLRLIAGQLDGKFAGEVIEFLMGQTCELQFSSNFWGRDRLKKESFLNLLLASECLEEVKNRRAIVPVAMKLLDALKKIAMNDSLFNMSTTADAVIDSIATTWQDEAETLPWLQSCLQLEQRSFISCSAVHAIAQGWKEIDGLDTFSWLKELVQIHEIDWVRKAAVEAIAQQWKDDPDTLNCLREWALSDKNPDVRSAAMEEIAQWWTDRPETLPWLKERIEDEHPWVRSAIVKGITRGWQDSSDTLFWLQEHLREEKDGWVRGTILRVIARVWKDDSETLPLLKQRAKFNEDPSEQIALLEVLSEGWKDDPDTLPLLKTSTTHANEQVRWAAVEVIASGYKDEPGIFELLSQIARTDPFVREKDWLANPRQTALEALLKNYPDQPEVVEILRDRSLNDPDENLRQFAQEKLAEWEGQ